MTKCYVCRKCDVEYSVEYREKSMFCINCETCLVERIKPSLICSPPENHGSIKPDNNSSIDFKNVYLPDEYKDKLISAHQRCSQIMRVDRENPEPIETALFVEEYRWFWKPEQVKFVLVAESHVRTSGDELKVKIIRERLPSNYPADGPLNFVKLVYCLGYGAPFLLDFPGKIENNPGTKQYIDLFAELVGLTHQRSYMTRLKWRAHVLNTIKEMGIWLLDASVHACYMGKKKRFREEKVKKRLPNEIVKKIVPISWRKYVKPVIDDLSIEENCVWIIGKGLYDLLRGEYVRGSNWIYQPNAIVSGEKKRERKIKLRKAMRQFNIK